MEIRVLNTSFVAVDTVDIISSLIWTDRYCGYGDFELYTEISASLLSLLQEDYYLVLTGSEHVMIIESIEIKTNITTGNKLLIKGRSIESVLTRRTIIHQTQIDTNIQAAIHNLVDRAFINPEGTNGAQGTSLWRLASEIVWLDNADTRITSAMVEGQYWGNNLYDVIKTLCEETGIGFKVILNSNNKFEVSLYMGQDRSYTQLVNPFVIFSPNFENLVNSNYFRSKANYRNLALLYGYLYDTGALHIRWSTLHKPAPAPSGLVLREHFLDLRTVLDRMVQGTTDLIDTAIYNAQLEAVGNQILREENPIVEVFEGQADTTVGFKYGVDFFLGDIVQIENEYGLTGRAKITEVTFSESPSGSFVYPTFTKL